MSLPIFIKNSLVIAVSVAISFTSIEARAIDLLTGLGGDSGLVS